MSETMYRKVGRRYEPIAWHEEVDVWPEGATLLVVSRNDGCTSMRAVKVAVDMNASTVATLMALKHELYEELRKAQEPELKDVAERGIPLNEEKKRVSQEFRSAFKKDFITIDYPRFEEVVERAVDRVMGDER